ncbi:MAG: gliding motility lipoprotein GldD [Bacteroidales bacterium]
MKNKTLHFPLIAFILFATISCNTDYYPKPRGFFRIDLPEKEYRPFDTNFPYTFEYPKYAVFEQNTTNPNEPYWINLAFPQFKGKLHLSYKKINGNFDDYVEDTRTMVMKHIPKANAIETKLFEDQLSKVYGMTYTIDGVGTASPYQFYVSDSVNHFLRGALYFNVVPNNDSLEPVINFLKEDINHLIESLKWND